MALLEVNFLSRCLGTQTTVNVILPQRPLEIGADGTGELKDEKSTERIKERQPQNVKYPALYLLHGSSDDESAWLRKSNIERHVAGLNLAVIMPNAQLSYYENMLHGARYYDFVTKELPEVMEALLPISSDASDRYVCGLSMGGMGALSMGLRSPERYAACGILSSGNLLYREIQNYTAQALRPSGGAAPLTAVYGTNDLKTLQETDWDPFVSGVENMAAGKKLPRFFHVCGTEDFLLDSARLTRNWFLSHPGIRYTYMEAPGSHNWDFWDKWIKEYLTWLNIK